MDRNAKNCGRLIESARDFFGMARVTRRDPLGLTAETAAHSLVVEFESHAGRS
jgi:hypothetical protein